MPTTHIIFNPASGGYSPDRARRIVTLLDAAGVRGTVHTPPSEGEARSLASTLCGETSPPLLIVAGGDGTVNTLLNGMLPGRATLGVIPFGTANVIAHELGVRSIPEAIGRIASGRSRPVTIGEIEGTCGTRRRFLLMAGIGIDGAIVRGVTPPLKRRFGKGAYLVAAIRETLRWDRSTRTVSDGARTVACHTVIVTNGSRYAGGYHIDPNASIFDPSLSVIPLTFTGPVPFLARALTIAVTGRFPTPAHRWVVTDAELTVRGGGAAQVDGDPFGEGEFRVRVIPGFTPLAC